MNNEPVAWMSNGKEFYVQKNYCPDFIPLYTHPADQISELEQQLKEEIQARADALDGLNNRMMKFMKSYNEMAWKLEEVGGAYTHPADLTDEEIMDCIEDKTGYSFNVCDEDLLDFARAILRKAQE